MKFALLAALSLTGVVAYAQPKPMPKDFVQQAATYVDAYAKAGRFSGAVLIEIDGKVAFRKAYGFADYTKKTPMTAETPMAIFSISKSFTAGAILLLQEKGLLDVQDKASKYLDDLPEAWKEITIQQLVTHSSGIGDEDALAWYEKRYGHPLDSSADSTRRPATPPGSEFQYSNLGYMILSEIITKVAGKPYETYLQDAIFTPLKMTTAGTGGYWEHAPVARGHRLAGAIVMPNDQYLSIIRGAGNVHATVDDLLKWRRAIDEPGFFSEASRKILHTPIVKVSPESFYSYGWFYHSEYPYWEHTGGGASCETSVSWLPERKTRIIILKNSDSSVGPLFDTEIVGMAYNHRQTAPKLLPLETLDRFQGVYRGKDGKDTSIGFLEQTIVLQLSDRDPKVLEYAGGNKFQTSGVVAIFDPRKDGFFDLRLVLNGKTTWLGKRLTPTMSLAAYAGSYGQAAPMKFAFEPKGRWLMLAYEDKQASPKPFYVPLLPSGKDQFSLFGQNGRVDFVFLRDEKGRITTVRAKAKGTTMGTLSRTK